MHKLMNNMTNLTPLQVTQITTLIDKKVSEALTKSDGVHKKWQDEDLGRIKSLEERILELEKENKKFKEDLETRQISQVAEGEQEQTDSTGLWSRLVTSPAVRADITNILVSGKASVQKKEKNVIIFGVEKRAGENVKGIVGSIFEEIGVQLEKYKVTRFKESTNGNAGPILVELEDTDSKMEVLKAASKLRDSTDYKKVYINRDLTQAEMKREKELRVMRNERNEKLPNGTGHKRTGRHKFEGDDEDSDFFWGIRNGELKKIKKIAEH